MHLLDSQIVCSPSDLVNFLGCSHLSELDRQELYGSKLLRSFSESDQLLVVKGKEHETAYLQSLRNSGKKIVEIPSLGPDRASRTLAAMKEGADLIYHAVLGAPGWEGVADFLTKIEKPSKLGPYSYEVTEIKLARHEEPRHVIQLGLYSGFLGELQGCVPDQMHLVLGHKLEKQSYRVIDFAAYICHAQKRLERFLAPPPKTTEAEPCAHCAQCHRNDHCEEHWEKTDHLSLVANIQRSQRDKLVKANVTTLTALARLEPRTSIRHLNDDTCERLRSQAVLQLHKRTTGNNKHELIDCEPGRGFDRLPKPDPGDLFFDMEGDPLHPGGLEYLFGVYYHNGKQLTFRPFWAHSSEEEKATFAEFMAFVGDHLARHPNAFIYHYNHYETTALKRLSCRNKTAEDQIDDLLRTHKFVDLYRVVREALRVSQPSYSLKKLEAFYMEERSGDVATAGDSILIYNRWCETKDDTLLQALAAYNEFDCRSTAELRNWLLTLRPNTANWFTLKTEEKVESGDDEKSEKRQEAIRRYTDATTKLCQKASASETDPLRVLADLLGYHRREEKPQWWDLFDRQDRADQLDELREDYDCLAGLERRGEPVPDVRSFVYRYWFPPQQTKRRVGDDIFNVATTKSAGRIVDIEEAASIVAIRVIKSNTEHKELKAIGPGGPINNDILRKALYRVADDVLSEDSNYHAIRNLLAKALPQLQGRKPGEPLAQSDDLIAATTDAVSALDLSYLFIQGPPGAGKTFTSAHVIVELIRRGKKVGVSANSHKAIHNLLNQIEDVASIRGVAFEGIKKNTESEESKFHGKIIQNVKKTEDVSHDAHLLAGTAWFFAHEYLDQHLDVLFIDEAGQVSLANVIAMGTSAKNIVLVGDQMQLGQPTQGVHPEKTGSGLSVLDYLLSGSATVAPDRGIFLDRTFRMRPEVCAFISTAFYDGRLQHAAVAEKRKLVFSREIEGLRPEGIVFWPVTHSGCSQKSEEEGVVIQQLVEELLKQEFRDEKGKTRPLTLADILIVSPYNVQVNYLSNLIPGAKVGTVDKFQGQEASVVLVSMATSGAEDLPRDIDFLFSANRLNVALSRAQCLAVLVASPDLLATPCRTVDQLRLVNKFCLLAEYSTTQSLRE